MSGIGLSSNSNDAGAAADPTGKAAATSKIIPTPTYFAFWSTGPASSYPILSHSLISSILLFLSATHTLPLIQPIIQPFLSFLSLFLLRITFILTAVVSFLHWTGALRRYALKFAQDELSKNLNGTLITISDIQIDLWRGRVIAQDLILHNQNRDAWEWDSPCLARLGRIEATLNFASVIQIPMWGRILDHTFFDVYTVLVEDVQVFVEKRKNVFNFHLLDASLDIPDHTLIMEEYKKIKAKRRKQELGEIPVEVSQSLSSERSEERGDLGGSREGEISCRENEEQANQIVENLVGAVSKIGEAAKEGGSEGLRSALINQKDGLVRSLKRLHSQKSMKIDTSAESKDWKAKKERGMSVMRELGKVVEKNVAEIKNQVTFLQKPPEKKQGWVEKPPDDIRVGSMLFREARIFTKDVLVAKGGSGDGAVKEVSMVVTESGHGLKEGSVSATTSPGWSKPIVILELAITGAELCPPMSARNPTNGMPVVGISLVRLMDIILKRLMTEAAKSNTGRLFQGAFGDVFSFVEVNVSGRKD